MMNLEYFFASLRNLNADEEIIAFCRKYVLHGTPYIFGDREDDYYEFRRRISDKFNIGFHEVFLSGSAQLGFSPYKRKQFDYDSDIDVAIVSNHLYERDLRDVID